MHKNQFEVNLLINEGIDTHIHPELELIYVLSGNVKVTIKDKSYLLSREDIILINSSLQHSIQMETNATACCIKYDYQVLVHVLKKPNSFFFCNSAEDDSEAYEKLRRLCWAVVYQEILSAKKTDSLKYSIMYEIMDLLIEEFLPDDTNPIISENYDADEKLQAIIHYVHQNYQDGISLSELAKDMYTSTSTLSRLFKKQTGTYFAEYVNQVRIRYAVDELLYTEKNMTKIAMDCGFSNASAFTKVFREVYRMAPTEYRQKMRANLKDNKNEVKSELRKNIEKNLKSIAGNKTTHQEGKDAKEFVSISDDTEVIVNTKTSHAFDKKWNKAINIGAMHDLTTANVQFHLQYLVKEIGFKYVRIWSLLSKQMQMTDGSTIGMYNFDLVDGVLDFLVSLGVHPWFDLVRRPNANVRDADDNVWYEDDNIEFKSKRAWEALIEYFLKHVVRRYGIDEVKNWKFEFGREPFHDDYNIVYDDPKYDFLEVYKYMYDKIKEIAPGAEIGYSAGPSNLKEKEITAGYDEFIRLDKKPDFVSFILFPYMPRIGDDRKKFKSFARSLDVQFESKEVSRIRDIMKKHGLEDCKLFISEWNLTVSTRNYLNDSCFRASCFCRKMVELCENVDMFTLWMGTDWISNYYDALSIANGCGGLLTKDRIRKPIFYALTLMNRLGDEIIAKGSNYIVTKKNTDEYEVLCFNLSWYGPEIFLKAENQSSPREMDGQFDIGGPLTLNLTLEGMSENCGYFVKKRTVNAEHGSILDEWKKFNYETHLERNDVKYLQEICVPSLGISRVKTEGDKLKLVVPMMSQEISSFHIFPLEL